MMENKRYYTRDASEPFLAPESVDLFLIHPPYFNAYSDPHGKPEGQLNNASDRDYFVNKITDTIKHMEMALKPTGTIIVGLPTDANMYKIIGKINSETNLQYGPLFFWDYTDSPRIVEIEGKESNVFLNLHKGSQQRNLDYKLDSYTLTHPWIIPERVEELSHLGWSHNSASEIVYEKIISSYSKPGDVVADIMAGTGLVLSIAKKMNRETIYNDISDSQLRLAKYLIDGEEDVPMKLIRKEVIDLMTKEVQDVNKQQMDNFNMPIAQQEQYIKESTNELNRINGILFDMLVKNGVIR
jgi:DNA modification methylase